MIQWDRDFVGDDDSSIIVQCDRPDDYVKQVKWGFGAKEIQATLKAEKHEGPTMWMEIQKGEGPNASKLQTGETVFLGDTMTIVLALEDKVFWFGANILSCTAVDGMEINLLIGT